ncbi:MAG: IS4 family transposase [Desulfobacteraceae bacterium]|nr:IS4 family transposase [Desulfobacteraceae bacterium]
MRSFRQKKVHFDSRCYSHYLSPLQVVLPNTPTLESKGNRPLKMTFEDQLHALMFFHLQEHDSARDLIQHLKEDDFAKEFIAPDGGISRSSFSEAINSRGLEQLQYVFQELCKQAQGILPSQHSDLGDLVSIDGSLIDAVLSMYWADYRKSSKKAKGHFGFDINHKIPSKVYLTDGKGPERPFVNSILSKGQTGIMDRGYQSHKDFDLLQDENKHFVCRIKTKTTRTIVSKNPVNQESHVFYDAIVLLGTPGVNQTKKSVRVVGYTIAGIDYYVATDRHDLTCEQVAKVYKLRWDIETFFKWWKKHLKVYHLIARSKYGLMVQILGGLISYLLMSIYCHEQFNETVSIKRIRQLRINIQNELRVSNRDTNLKNMVGEERILHAKT